MSKLKFEGLAVVLEWKYGLVASTKQSGDEIRITAWRHPTIPQPDNIQIEKDFAEHKVYLEGEKYKVLRASEYPAVGDQLDEIIKILKSIKDNGLSLNPEGDAFLARIDAIKSKYPKP